MNEDYINALKKERDEWRKKYKDLKKEFESSDNGVSINLKSWIENNDKPELYADYPNHKYYVDKMKLLLKGVE